MMMTIQSQVGTVILSLEARRLYGEPTRICNSRREREAGRPGSNPRAPRTLPRHSPGQGARRRSSTGSLVNEEESKGDVFSDYIPRCV
jgi:hypothetical protein